MTADVIQWPDEWRVRDPEVVLLEVPQDLLGLHLARVLVAGGYNLRPLPGGRLRLTYDPKHEERTR